MLTNKEKLGIAQIIDGTIDSMLQDVDYTHEDVAFWMTILRKLGAPAEVYVKQWVEIAKMDEGVDI